MYIGKEGTICSVVTESIEKFRKPGVKNVALGAKVFLIPLEESCAQIAISKFGENTLGKHIYIKRSSAMTGAFLCPFLGGE